MSFVIMVIRKILKNKSLSVCLLSGMVLAVSLFSSIPMYTQAILQKALIKHLDDSQKKDSVFPGSYTISINQGNIKIEKKLAEVEQRGDDVYKDKDVIAYYNKRLDSLKKMNDYMNKNTEGLINLPTLAKLHSYNTDIRAVLAGEKGEEDATNIKRGRLLSVSDLDKHIKLVDGKMPSKTPVNGIYEVLVSELALKDFGVTLGQEITLKDTKPQKTLDPIKIRPVGVFKEKDPDNLFWYFKIAETASKCFVIDETLMENEILTKQPQLAVESKWFFAFDYRKIEFSKLGYLFGGHDNIINTLNNLAYDNTAYTDAPIIAQTSIFKSESTKTSQMLLSLYIPLLIMLGLFICMVSKLIIEREKNEISVLGGRGINRIQVASIYIVQGLLLGLVALLIGPFIGMILVKFIGLSSGFMEFSSRKPLPTFLNGSTYLYSVLAVILSVLMMVIPAFLAGRTSIVHLKQSLARKSRFTFWEKFCLDIFLLGLSAYGYYTFVKRIENLTITHASAVEIEIDPLLFIVPMLFIIGLGLFLMRFYPILIRFILWAGKRFWPVEIHIPLNQVSRSLRSYHFLIIFLIMTLSMGIFSATAARTINRNLEEKIMYMNGSDLVVQPFWSKMTDGGSQPLRRNEGGHSLVVDPNDPTDTMYTFIEPDFNAYKKLDGIESAARIFNWNGIGVHSKSLAGNARLMGIDTNDFARTTWFRKGLLKYNFYDYLNLLGSEKTACLISRPLSKAMDIKVGDTIQVSRPNIEEPIGDLTVYGIVDYWPSWSPYLTLDYPEGTMPELIITNLSYTQELYHLKPYDVWLKLKPGASVEQVYKDIQKKKLKIDKIINSLQETSEKKNEPNTLTVNGSLTLGFIISGIVCFLGFLIYWILSIKSRTLQFGIFRAMGLPVKKLIGMAIFEQLLISAVASVIGILIGLVASKLFVPFFQMAIDAKSQVPPFRVSSNSGDRLEIYLIVGFMLLLCMCIIGFILTRIKANQAIKLGEE